jgi:cyclic nucleotide gated channel, plant
LYHTDSLTRNYNLLNLNPQVFLHAVLARKRKMQLRFRDMEWWMRRRQLPSRLRQRVRKYERERWAAVTGDEEMEMIKDLPEGLRRDIKRYLCLELVKQVKSRAFSKCSMFFYMMNEP